MASLAAQGIRVNVLLSPTNFFNLEPKYKALPGAERINVERLLFQDRHLSIERMHKLMAYSEQEGNPPLYMEIIQRILRDFALANQAFTFSAFKSMLKLQKFFSIAGECLGDENVALGVLLFYGEEQQEAWQHLRPSARHADHRRPL